MQMSETGYFPQNLRETLWASVVPAGAGVPMRTPPEDAIMLDCDLNQWPDNLHAARVEPCEAGGLHPYLSGGRTGDISEWRC